MDKKRVMWLVVFLVMISFGYAMEDGDVSFTYSKGEITITIDADRDDEYFNQIQFYNDYAPSGYEPPTPDGLVSVYVLCPDNCFGEEEVTLSFGDIKVFEPGTYYLVVHDLGEEEERNIIKEFYVDALDLLGCYYEGSFISNRLCVADVIGDDSLRPLYCEEGEINERACGVCGCEEGRVCSADRYTFGFCIEPSAEEPIEEIIPDETIPEELEEEELYDDKFCSMSINLEEYPIPRNKCVNEVIWDRDVLPFNHDLFSGFCQCRVLNLDLDNDGFNSTEYYGGMDCDDRPNGEDGILGTPDDGRNINPGAFEICGNNIDENCDGVFNNGCEGICDTDNDGHEEFPWCFGPKPNDDCDDNDPEVHGSEGMEVPMQEVCDGKDNDCDGIVDEGFSEFEEICGNEVDENCDGQLDDGCVCEEVIEDGVRLFEEILGLCSNGLRECIEGKEWNVITEPYNGVRGDCPLISYINEMETKFVELRNREVVRISSTYVCTNPNGCKDVKFKVV